jgi:hypothetical protein
MIVKMLIAAGTNGDPLDLGDLANTMSAHPS